MCGICGCTEENDTHQHESDTNQAPHQHTHHDIIRVEHDLLAKNNQFAAANRSYFLAKKITAINLMSSPGSGKTTLLTRTLSELKHQLNMAVIVGDQQTDYDAEQLKSSGAQALQINTGRVCHLDAHAVGHTVEHLSLQKQGILFIENVGNLVCPALFDLGEAHRVVLLSVTEGDNKPLKYPDMFRKADVMILTKMDLLPYVAFDVDKSIEYVQRINPSIHVLSLSATSGAGLTSWYEWLQASREMAFNGN
ncbi:MAG: hydrogenase nickel incorporation protein HypB [Legionellales bacterium]|nr:hydrogenase nickel incorporation protein HypB [Legionellales bacterium]